MNGPRACSWSVSVLPPTLVGGCGTWLVVGGGGGRDTLLSPEASAVRQVSLARVDRPSLEGGGGCGGVVSCELDSGREHLRSSPVWVVAMLYASLRAAACESMGGGAVDREAGVCSVSL